MQKSVKFPTSDGSFVVISENHAAYLIESGIKNIRVSKRKKRDGTVVRHFYVMDVDAWEINEVKVFHTLRRTAVEFHALHLKMPGEGMLYHDNSDSYLPENFRRDAWPELDKTVVEQTVETPKTGQTAEPLRAQQAEWLNNPTLYATALRKTKRVGDADTNDVVQEAFLVVTEKITAGLCDATSEAQLCAFFLATCQNKTAELSRTRKKVRKSHKQLTEDFAEGEQHHVRCTAPKFLDDDGGSNYGAHRDSNAWKHQAV